MKKAELRKRYRQKRSELNPQEVESRSQEVVHRFLDFFDGLEQEVHYVHIFLPIERNKEVNTWPLVQALRERKGVHIVVSRTDFQEGRMEHYLLEPHIAVITNEMGIPEPEEGTPIPEERIDIVILPLLAYDRQGDRVGYGAGFYDHFLEACREDVIKVGLSFFDPVERIEDVGDHDIVLDHCATPEKVYSFTKG